MHTVCAGLARVIILVEDIQINYCCPKVCKISFIESAGSSDISLQYSETDFFFLIGSI